MMSGMTTQRLNSTNFMRKPMRFDCSNCHAKQTLVIQYTSVRDPDVGGNCSECGVFVLADASRDKIVS